MLNFDTIRAEALKLPLKSRGYLASDLLSSLDVFNESENEQLWLDEAKRRAQEIDDGDVELVSWDEVNRRAEAVLHA